MSRIIRLSVTVCCLFALITLPVACGNDKKEEVPAKKAEHVSKAKVEHAPEAEHISKAKVEHAPEAEHVSKAKIEHAPEAEHVSKAKVEHAPEAEHVSKAKVEHAPKAKPSPDKVISMLKAGNIRQGQCKAPVKAVCGRL